MRAPLGILYEFVRKGTHATPWPYLARLAPKPIKSVGLGDLEGALHYRPGPEVSVVVADCQGLRNLAGPGRWSIAALLVTDGEVGGEIDRLGQRRYGAWHRGPGGKWASPGFDKWEERQLEVTLLLDPDSPVKVDGRHLTVRLPASLGISEFWWDLHTVIGLVAVHTVLDTAQARHRMALLALDPSVYRRETARGAQMRDAAIDLLFFRAHLDADALVSLIEAVISAHLLDLARDGGVW